MRLKSIRNCRPGDTLARSIYSETGTVLVGAGVELTERMLARLKNMNITAVYIADKRTDDILIEPVISEEARREAMTIIHESFRMVESAKPKWQLLFSDRKFGRRIRQAMTTIIQEIKSSRSVMNLMADACAFDNYIFAHSLNVALYSIAVALKSGFSEKEVVEIGIGGLLHDIGKTCVPEAILKKQGRLTEEEFAIMQKHTEYGFEILSKQDEIPLLSAHCAFQHHERLNGSGYPRRLKGEEIHPYARLMAVTDVFDALTSHRVYRPPMLPHEAMEILYTGSDSLYDASYVAIMRDTIALYPLGLSVTLNTGESGVVVDANKGYPSRPIVRILVAPNGEEVDEPYEYDLSKRLDLMIVASDELL